MALGLKTGGRRKGSKNKRTLLLENAGRQLLDNASQILGEQGFEGDAHALLILIYKNSRLPLEIRLQAAKAAIRFEKPALASTESNEKVETIHYAISDVPLTAEQWEKKYVTKV